MTDKATPGSTSNEPNKQTNSEPSSPSTPGADRRRKSRETSESKNLLLRISDAFNYYRSGTKRFERIVLAQFEGNDSRCDISVRDDGKYDGVEKTQKGWNISFPAVCVVCGKKSEEPPRDETRRVADDTWPIRLLAGSLFLGLIPGFCLLGWWAPPVIVVIGGGVGYLFSSRKTVCLRLHRCPAHAKRRKQPLLYHYAKELVIRVKEPVVKQEFVKQNRRRAEGESEDANSSRRRRSFVPNWLAQHGAKFAAVIWIGTGVLQLVAAVLETIAVAVLVFVLLSKVSGKLWEIGVILLLALAYVLFRLRIGWTFFRAGMDTLSREAKGIIANALGSIGLGVMFALPLWPIITGKWQNLPHSDPANAVSLTTFPGLWVPIGFALNALLLIFAGLLALAGRRGFHEIEAEDQTFMFRTSCPACDWPVDVLGQTKINTLHTCVECGKSFRLAPEETRGKK